jgi:hypothetical protein
MNDPEHPRRTVSRRSFIKEAAAIAGVAMADPRALGAAASGAPPWYRRALRWGQTNIVEIDPLRYDISWWREHWKRTRLQGVVVNAGGIVAYYPTEVPYHRRAEFLADRDLFGELVAAAHEDGLSVLARMDSNRAGEPLFSAHEDWFARDRDGKPYRATGLPVACVNGPYYDEHIPAILREVASRYRPEGFTDNNWTGPMRDQPCYCARCERSFRSRSGSAIPSKADWSDPLYRQWILWNYDRRLEIWEAFNRVTREAGGPDCLWSGMMAGSQSWQARVFRDDREVCRRAELIMLDDQRRFDDEGFQHNGEVGKRLRSVGGWDKVIPESMAMYDLSEHNFRLATKPEPEARLWVVEGFAGGVQPWWHHVGADQQDRRMLQTAAPLWQWHAENETYLVNRRPVATVGLLWSQRNMDFLGRGDGDVHVEEPWNGFRQALIRARIPYVPVHVEDVAREARDMKLLILPNLGVLSDPQVAGVRAFVDQGGSLLATGISSLLDEWGDPRRDFALADLFGAHLPSGHGLRDDATRTGWARGWEHTYLRLSPERRGSVYGPHSDVPAGGAGERHEVLRGFDETDILAFGGILEPLRTDPRAEVPLTFVPPSPTMPPESVWMRVPRTDVPGLVLNELPGGSRVAYLPADVDRRFARDYRPDHGHLLANLSLWLLRNDLPLRVEGPGLIDCHLYQQRGRLVLHLVNLTSSGTWRTPVHELIPVGPLQVRVRLPEGLSGQDVRSLVSGQAHATGMHDGWVRFEVASIRDHEVVVIT